VKILKIAIIVNGIIDDYNYHKSLINDCDLVICGDGGANHAYKMDIIPDYILGDLDSINDETKDYYENKNVEFIKFPSKKDKTDTEICIDYASHLKATEIILLGALGGRMDHAMANVNLLYYILKKGIKGSIVNETDSIFICDKELTIKGNIGENISLIPLYGDVIGVTLENLEYPLNDFTIEKGSSRGISNVMINNKCKISLKSGYLLICKSKDNKGH
jgi:thiamine pyrophosphokinase